ncbi:MAG TPA: hypothetical protein VFM50_15920 [Nocardioidaceae bacterium]|jgi:hypothetical protein|nr:hypothetical protein [Nocardioidaceae bacterium]
MSDPTPREPFNANEDLLDRQILDKDGLMVAKVDDVEIEQLDDGRVVVTGLLTGPGALGPRLGGFLGALTTAAWSRLAERPEGQPKRIGFEHVREIDTAVRLDVARGDLDVDGLEAWTRERVIEAIPAAGEKPA